MTICVLTFDEIEQEFLCFADTRIRVGQSTVTDSGAKMLPIPVAGYAAVGNGQFTRVVDHTFGFAFAGSTLAAINTYAMATACSQSLTKLGADHNPPPEIAIEELAELFRRSAEHYILEMSSRMVVPGQPISRYFFQAVIFGFCPRTKAFKAFAISPNTSEPQVKVITASMQVENGCHHPFGSGVDSYKKIGDELHVSGRNPTIVSTLLELIKREERGDVGGHLQVGIANKLGFSLVPTLAFGGKAHYLGVNVEGESPLQGFRIGFKAFMPDFLS